jgi:hypothetical protein
MIPVARNRRSFSIRLVRPNALKRRLILPLLRAQMNSSTSRIPSHQVLSPNNMSTIAPQPCSLRNGISPNFPQATATPTLLCQEQSVALLDGDPVPRVLVVGRKPCWVGRLGDFAVNDLFERVDALGRVLRVGDKHEMHAAGRVSMICRVMRAPAWRGAQQQQRRRTWQ